MLLRVVNTCLVCYLTPPPSACQRKFPSKFESRKTGLSLTFRSRRYGSEKLQTVLKAVYRDGTANEWKEEATGRLQEVFGERLFRAVAGATSAPLAQFISSPKTFLHSLDPRVKQAWLLALVVLPSRSHMVIRLGLVAFLALLTWCSLPPEISQDQLVRTSFLSGILFLMLAFTTDISPPLVQTRAPPPQALQLPSVPKSLKVYSYVLLKFGPLQLTRKGLSLATTASCLSFILLQSASLCLATTTPEQLAAALRWYMLPSVHFGVPVDEIILTLLLSLRFISLVFDEVRNTALGMVARGIQWKKLTMLETVDIFGLYLRRIFYNLFSHAEQISQAMIARGFPGNPSAHKIYLPARFSIRKTDILAVVLLGCLMGLAIHYECYCL
eukprot:TRINITY_DN1769_c0_g1_i2.p1 TRINITY_DN1769_c0_g1~~TRINITY_DN1769_c0_g1_i2.p1  ORF type:complete len:385 (+),score=35.94 TRINITY_DN1769_c0_g1_i2:59-1213(+)